jgi:cytochrome c oxidase subunit 3
MSSARPAPQRDRSRFPALLSGLGLLAGLIVARLSATTSKRDAAPPPVGRTEGRRRPPLGTQRRSAVLRLRRGEPGSGGYYGAWTGPGDAEIVRHIEFQYEGMEHQADTALSGMWLFLTTELVFFGGLFLLYMVYRFKHPDGIAEGSRQTDLWIGTVNTVLLLTSSAVFSYGLGRIKAGDNRRLFWASAVTGGLGVAFLLLKEYEWWDDLAKGLFPGPNFAITGPHSGGAKLFWSFYFIGTGLHAIHMIIGVALVAWVAVRARQGRYLAGYFTPVEVVGLYWSFVDMVWLALFPTIYLVDRIGS